MFEQCAEAPTISDIVSCSNTYSVFTRIRGVFAPQVRRLFKNLLLLYFYSTVHFLSVNFPCAQVIGKRKGEVGLVVPANFAALTSELRIARILEREPTARAEKYSHFELKNITFKENKLAMLF